MFKANRAGAGRMPGRRRALHIIGLTLGVFLGASLLAAAHYEFGFYPSREHPPGNRLYRINSYEQFMKQKMGDAPMLVA